MRLKRIETRTITKEFELEVEPIRSVYEMVSLVKSGKTDFWRVEDHRYCSKPSTSLDQIISIGAPVLEESLHSKTWVMPIKRTKGHRVKLFLFDNNVCSETRGPSNNHHFLFKTESEARAYQSHIQDGGDKLTQTTKEDAKDVYLYVCPTCGTEGLTKPFWSGFSGSPIRSVKELQGYLDAGIRKLYKVYSLSSGPSIQEYSVEGIPACRTRYEIWTIHVSDGFNYFDMALSDSNIMGDHGSTGHNGHFMFISKGEAERYYKHLLRGGRPLDKTCT